MVSRRGPRGNRSWPCKWFGLVLIVQHGRLGPIVACYNEPCPQIVISVISALSSSGISDATGSCRGNWCESLHAVYWSAGRLVFSRYIDKLPADDAIFALLRERFQEAQLTCPEGEGACVD